MSRLDALPADQKSVLQLLLRQGKGYDDLSGLLRLDVDEVRSRAYDALDALGPGAGGLPSERRHEISDWLLGQQDPEQAVATRAFVDGSTAGRAWAHGVARELGPLAGDRLPELPPEAASDGAAAAAGAAGTEVPGGAGGPAAAGAAGTEVPGGAGGPAAAGAAGPAPAGAAGPAAAAAAGGAAASEAVADEASADDEAAAADDSVATPFAPAAGGAPRVSRRGGALLIGGAVALVAVVVVLVLVLTGGDDKKGDSATQAADTTSTQAQPQVRAQINLTPPKDGPAKKALAIVQIVDVSGQQAINAVSQGLPTSNKKAAYGIWVYNSPSQAKLIGGFDKTDNKGHLVFQGAMPKDVDVAAYKEILVTQETQGNPTRPGTVYLRGAIQNAAGG
jgi:hypothetical protein